MNVIAHNLSAMNAQRQYNVTTKKNRTLTEKLSSGYKINRAADDAAGLSISEKMRIQIRGLKKASNNIQDGISYVQVADGALAEVHDMLHRMSELAIQSANDTNTEADREALDGEVQQIKTEIDRIFKTTEFNTRKIWDEPGNNPIPTGRYYYEPAVRYKTTNGVSGELTEDNKTSIPKDYYYRGGSKSSGSYKLNADADGITVTWTDFAGTTHTSDKIEWADDYTGTHSFELKDYIQAADHPEVNNFTYTWTVHEAATLQDVIDTINGQSVSASEGTSATVQPLVSDGSGNLVDGSISGVSFGASWNYPALLASGKDFNAIDDTFIEGVQITNPAITQNNSDAFSFTFNMDNIGTVTANAYDMYYGCSHYTGTSSYKDVWWEVKYPNTPNEYDDTIEYYPPSADGTMNAIIDSLLGTSNKVGLQDGSPVGGSIVIKFALESANNFTYGDYTGNLVGSMSMSIQVGANDTVDTIKAKLTNLKGMDLMSRNSEYGSASNRALRDSTIKVELPEYKYDYKLNIQSSANPLESIPIEYSSLNSYLIGIDDLDVTTYDSASETIDKVAEAVRIVSEQRSLFGAYQNRLEHAMNIAENTGENTQAAESRLRDTDMADAMTEYSANQILMQAGQAMMAQANQNTQGILTLLS